MIRKAYVTLDGIGNSRENGRDGRIWTGGPLNPIQVRFQTAPRPDMQTYINPCDPTCQDLQVSHLTIIPLQAQPDMKSSKHESFIINFLLPATTSILFAFLMLNINHTLGDPETFVLINSQFGHGSPFDLDPSAMFVQRISFSPDLGP